MSKRLCKWCGWTDRYQGKTWIPMKVPDVSTMRAETGKAQPMPRTEPAVYFMINA